MGADYVTFSSGTTARGNEVVTSANPLPTTNTQAGAGIPYGRPTEYSVSVTSSGLYAAADNIGGIIEIPEWYASKLKQAVLIDPGATSFNVSSYWLSKRPTGNIVDNSPVALAEVDGPFLLGSALAFSSGAAVGSNAFTLGAIGGVGGAASGILTSQELTGSIYLVLYVSSGTPTFVSGTLTLTVYSEQVEWPGVSWRTREWV